MSKYHLFLGLLLGLTACKEETVLSDAYGNFEATTTTISSEANGKLLFLQVEEGQQIPSGKLIALVDTTSLDLQRRQIQANINTLPEKLRTALADIEVIQNQKANLVRERDRVQRLLNKKAATPKQLDDINGQIDVLDKQMEAVRSQTATANRATLSAKEPLVAQIAVLNEQIKKAYIHNPVSGTVLTKLAEAYEVVGMGAPLYRIGQLDTMTLRFYASAQQIQEVKVGSKIEVLVDQGADQYQRLQGTITWISEQAEFTPKTIQTKEDRVNLVYAIKASVPNPDGTLKIGMPAEVNFSSKPKEEANKSTTN